MHRLVQPTQINYQRKVTVKIHLLDNSYYRTTFLVKHIYFMSFTKELNRWMENCDAINRLSAFDSRNNVPVNNYSKAKIDSYISS